MKKFESSILINNWWVLHQELISSRYSSSSSSSSSCCCDLFKKSLRLRHFKSDQDKIWHDCALCKQASIDGVRFMIRWQPWHHFMQKVLPLVSEHEQSTECLCSITHPFPFPFLFTTGHHTSVADLYFIRTCYNSQRNKKVPKCCTTPSTAHLTLHILPYLPHFTLRPYLIINFTSLQLYLSLKWAGRLPEAAISSAQWTSLQLLCNLQP